MTKGRGPLATEMQPTQPGFAVKQAVRFTQERLDVLSPPDRQRLQGRVGVVEGFYKGTRKPIVYFPATQGQTDLRLFGVDPRQLELVSDLPSPLHESGVSDARDDSTTVSQSEADHLFD